MSGPPQKTKAQRQSELNDKFGNNTYKLIDYSHRLEPARIKHSCGQIFIVKCAESLFRGSAKCSCERSKQNNRTTASYNAEILQRKPKFTCVSFKGTGNTLTKYRHLECGRVFEQSFGSFNLSKHCPLCVGQFAQNLNVISLAKVTKRLDVKFGEGEFKITGNYTAIKQPVEFQHKCGYKFTKIPESLLKNKNPFCNGCMVGVSYARRTVRIIQGKMFSLQGFEYGALKLLLRKYKAKEIISDYKKVPRFDYAFNKKRSKYIPDFYIPSKNLIVEVKSKATMGLLSDTEHPFGPNLLSRLISKAKAVRRKGYKFRLYLMEKESRIKLPSNWDELNEKSILSYVRRVQ